MGRNKKESENKIVQFKSFVLDSYPFKEIEQNKLTCQINDSLILIFQISSKYDTIDLLKIENEKESSIKLSFDPQESSDWKYLSAFFNQTNK